MAILQYIINNTWAVVLMVFFFGASIFVHELGHFLAARWRGMKVERFSIGFGPKILGWTGKDGVEYRVSWIPLGGYVVLPQMVDMSAIEGEIKTDVSKLPPVSYSSKLIALSAGAFFNVLFAFALATVVWVAGQQFAEEEQTNVIGSVRPTVENSDGIIVPSPAAIAGLRSGDTVLAVDGKSVATFNDIRERVILGSGRDAKGNPRVTLTVRRGDTVFDMSVLPVYLETSGDRFRGIGISPAPKIIANTVAPGSVAALAGLRAGDTLTHIDGEPIQATVAISEYIARAKDRPVVIAYVRDGVAGTVTISQQPAMDSDTKAPASLFGATLAGVYTPVTKHIPPWTQVASVVTRTWKTLASLVNPRSDIGLNNMSSFIGIGKIMMDAAKYDFIALLAFVAFLNVSLAILNLLPIPVLDGGHIVLATIEKLRGRPLPLRFVMTMQSVFMLLLLAMIVYVSIFDVRRIIPQSKPAPQQQAPAK